MDKTKIAIHFVKFGAAARKAGGRANCSPPGKRSWQWEPELDQKPAYVISIMGARMRLMRLSAGRFCSRLGKLLAGI